MGKVVLNRAKSQARPSARPAHWYEDQAALARVYPPDIFPDIKIPMYDLERNQAQFLAEFEALSQNLIKFVNESKIGPQFANMITGFYRNIHKRISPDDPGFENMNGSKFEHLDNVGLGWVKKYLEIIAEYIIKKMILRF